MKFFAILFAVISVSALSFAGEVNFKVCPNYTKEVLTQVRITDDKTIDLGITSLAHGQPLTTTSKLLVLNKKMVPLKDINSEILTTLADFGIKKVVSQMIYATVDTMTTGSNGPVVDLSKADRFLLSVFDLENQAKGLMIISYADAQNAEVLFVGSSLNCQ